MLGPNISALQEHFSSTIANADQWVPLAVSIPIGVFGLCAIFIGNLADKIGDYYQGIKREHMMSLQITASSASATVFVAVGFFAGIAFIVVPINLGILYAVQEWQPNIGAGYTQHSAGVMLSTFIFGWVLAGRLRVSLQLAISLAIRTRRAGDGSGRDRHHHRRCGSAGTSLLVGRTKRGVFLSMRNT